MATPSSSGQVVMATGTILIYDVLELVIQTLVLGMYTVLILLSTRMLLIRGLKGIRTNQIMLLCTLFMYLLSIAYWAYSVADLVDRVLALPVNFTSGHDKVLKRSPLFNAILTVNYVITDAVVIWRAWILCLRQHRKYLCITIGFLALTAISVFGTIVFRIIGVVQSPFAPINNSSYLVKGINVFQIAALGMSLLSNLSATAIVAAAAWHYRSIIRAQLANAQKTSRALSLVAESGVLYCVSALMVLISALVSLPHGSLGDIYIPVHVQIAGAYPSFVLLLVGTQRSLSETTFLDTSELPAASRPSLGSAGRMSMQNRNRESLPPAVLSIQFATNSELSGAEARLPGGEFMEMVNMRQEEKVSSSVA
ncbi:hypothetical protein FB45DRAFT_891821 [Roridomyces roridus]|uniref:Uncharacterized protein n=1 Tax=Roridomyces roridus TaxID=1738132 RepID=A0AAD7CGE0_9AGAR|nr:hypothetical protein FB45DRAFT_891821 [Roridomyces roridus]